MAVAVAGLGPTTTTTTTTTAPAIMAAAGAVPAAAAALLSSPSPAGAMPTAQRVVGDWIVEGQIGAGSFATVWRGRHRVSGQVVAVKEMQLEKLNRKLQQSLESEIDILRRTQHPNIIRLLDIYKGPGRIFLILEYCAGGDMSKFIQRNKQVPESTARHFLQQLAKGLEVLRANHLIHRDLKPQNLLLSENSHSATLKIADFGFARSLQPQGLAETLCGSPLYMAPEILQFQKYDAKADLWSVGVILFELVTGRPPFSGANHVQLLRNIERNEPHIPQAVSHGLSEACISMCRLLLRRNPVERLSFEEFFRHPFLGMKPTLMTDSTVILPRDSRLGTAEPAHNEGDVDGGRAVSGDDGSPVMPFAMDDEPPFPSVPPIKSSNDPKAQPHTRAQNLPSSPQVSVRPPVKVPSARDLSEAKTTSVTTAVDSAGGWRSGSARGELDSFECIEREYVVVPKPGFSDSRPASPLSHSRSAPVRTPTPPPRTMSPQGTSAARRSATPTSPLVHHSTSPHRPRPHSMPQPSYMHQAAQRKDMDEPQQPSDVPSVRLTSLQRCAKLILELADHKLEAGQKLAALALHVLRLEVLHTSLMVAQAWRDPRDLISTVHDAAAGSAAVEKDFMLAVQQTDGLVNSLGTVERQWRTPDAVELVYQAALRYGRIGAVEEVIENYAEAAAQYAQSEALFYFCLVEAPALTSASNPLKLTAADRQRLRKYASTVRARHVACTAALQRLNAAAAAPQNTIS
eukprot:jgi/Chlat1/7898/Chrsp66S07205